MIDVSEQTVIDEVVQRLTASYPGVPTDSIEATVAEVYARYDGRPLRDYIPLFVEKNARRELADSRA